ncbi:MAG: CidA/LrgA family protein [Acetobacteraceae bacterium]|nr:CidA/LrgA family protein [Acetobacteraceae bacterium]
MTTRRFAINARRGLDLSRPLQIALLCVFWLAGEAVARTTEIPVPGGIVGMFIVLALLASGRLSLLSMRRGANWFLAEMLLFFIPAVLAIMDHQELMGWLGLKVLVVILAGTIIVMSVTALAVDLCFRWRSAHVHAGPALD